MDCSLPLATIEAPINQGTSSGGSAVGLPCWRKEYLLRVPDLRVDTNIMEEAFLVEVQHVEITKMEPYPYENRVVKSVTYHGEEGIPLAAALKAPGGFESICLTRADEHLSPSWELEELEDGTAGHGRTHAVEEIEVRVDASFTINEREGDNGSGTGGDEGRTSPRAMATLRPLSWLTMSAEQLEEERRRGQLEEEKAQFPDLPSEWGLWNCAYKRCTQRRIPASWVKCRECQMSQQEAIDSPALEFTETFEIHRGSRGAQSRWCCPRPDCKTATLRHEARCRGCNLPQNCFAAVIQHWKNWEHKVGGPFVEDDRQVRTVLPYQGSDLRSRDPRAPGESPDSSYEEITTGVGRGRGSLVPPRSAKRQLFSQSSKLSRSPEREGLQRVTWTLGSEEEGQSNWPINIDC